VVVVTKLGLGMSAFIGNLHASLVLYFFCIAAAMACSPCTCTSAGVLTSCPSSMSGTLYVVHIQIKTKYEYNVH
jgi:hypothetical protein